MFMSLIFLGVVVVCCCFLFLLILYFVVFLVIKKINSTLDLRVQILEG